MTILPKKKPPKDKNETENPERPLSPSGPTDVRGTRRPPSPGPPRWSSPPPVDHDRAAGHEPPSRYDEPPSSSGNKRRLRHRSPPSHGSVRKPRHESTRGNLAANGAGLAHMRMSGIRQVASTSTTASDQRTVSAVGPTNHAVEEELKCSGYNSEDECIPGPCDQNAEEMECWFETQLKEKRGYIIKHMGEDGACLFRAVADQVYGDQEMHTTVRQHCVDYMAKNVDFYKQFVTEDFTMYLNRKRVDNCHGNHVEMQALSELYNRPVEVYKCSSLEPINTFHGSYKTDNEPIRLSYHRNIHYNSVVDPHKATIGVGLGLPGFQPGLADKNLVCDAVRMSEDCQLEQTMLEDKLRETDWELTQDTINEQVARESYLQWLRDQEKYAKTRTSTHSACATCSTASDATAQQNWWEMTSSLDQPRTSRSPRSNQGSGSGSGQNSPKQFETSSFSPDQTTLSMMSSGQVAPLSPVIPSTSSGRSESPASSFGMSQSLEGAVGGVGVNFPETASLMNELPPHLFGLSDWDDDGLLAQVIAQSQQEYLNGLKMAATAAAASSSSSSAMTDNVRPDKGKSLMRPKDSRQ